MADNSKIEWTDATFNPWIGCTKVSPACDHCYAEALMDKRHGRVEWGGERSRTSAGNWRLPLRWQKNADAFMAEHGRRQRVFCASLADVFDNQVPPDWRSDLWSLIRDTPDFDWQLLTKRPQNIRKMLPDFWDEVKGHVWLGTTVENQHRAHFNIPHLLQHDAAVRFISAEPLLGPLDDMVPYLKPVRDWGEGWLNNYPFWFPDRPLDWVITGGESGPQARPTNPQWFRDLRDQCEEAGVPFFFKQWGEWVSVSEVEGPGRIHEFPDHRCVRRVGKQKAGRLLDGVEHSAFPEVHGA